MPDVSFDLTYKLVKSKQNTSDQSTLYHNEYRVYKFVVVDTERNSCKNPININKAILAIICTINRQNTLYIKVTIPLKLYLR